MAIKTGNQGNIPAVDLDYIQFSEFRMKVMEKAPHSISISALMRPYGMAGQRKVYDKDTVPLSIQNLDAYIQTKVPGPRKAEAVAAMTKVQEGLGTLASIYLNIPFVGVE